MVAGLGLRWEHRFGAGELIYWLGLGVLERIIQGLDVRFPMDGDVLCMVEANEGLGAEVDTDIR